MLKTEDNFIANRSFTSWANTSFTSGTGTAYPAGAPEFTPGF